MTGVRKRCISRETVDGLTFIAFVKYNMNRIISFK